MCQLREGVVIDFKSKFRANSIKLVCWPITVMLVQDLYYPEPPWLPVAAIMFCPAWTVLPAPDVGKRSFTGDGKRGIDQLSYTV